MMMMMMRDSCAVVSRARIRGRAVRETATRSVSIERRARVPSSRIYSFVCSVVALDTGSRDGGRRRARRARSIASSLRARGGGGGGTSIRIDPRARGTRTIEEGGDDRGKRREKNDRGRWCVGVDGGGRARDGDATGARGDRGDEARRRRRGGRFKRREGDDDDGGTDGVRDRWWWR